MRIPILLLLLCVSLLASGQHQSAYSRVKIHFDGKSVQELARTGIDIEHGQMVKERFFITDLGSWEIEAVRNAGFAVDIEIQDVQAYYQSQMTGDREALDCFLERYSYDIPAAFSLGSMGGYHTLEEMKNTLDAMSVTYPHLITVKQHIGPLTQEGNKVFWIKISDNPDTNEEEPKVLYTALHHAREPISLSQMLFYMWHLLEQYGSDPEITYLVNNTQLFFVPCVNPDGYAYNTEIYPEGGGMWRKNMRDNNGDGHFEEKTDGVDLNRNYGYAWGHDETGSSSSEGSLVYRGPDAFSEPESQAVKQLIDDHNFEFIINYHSYGNFLLFPWGYANEENPQKEDFEFFAKLLTKENMYPSGNSFQTLGYVANGTATDYQYSEGSAYAFTPEIGSGEDGFWPATEDIVPLCKSAMHQNLTIARLPHNYAVMTELSEAYVDHLQGTLDITLQRFGLAHGSFLLDVEALSPQVDLEFGTELVSLQKFESRTFQVPYTIDASALPGDTVFFELRLNNGAWTKVETIAKIIAEKDIVLQDQGLTLQAWEQDNSSWGVTLDEAYSMPASLTDSPDGNYAESNMNILALKDPVDLSNATHAVLNFVAKWEIEELIDYAAVQVSTDGDNYQNLCGRHSTPGSVFQLYQEPLYDGSQETWVKESISLDAYLGAEIDLRFIMVSDGFLNLDGIYIDDIELVLYNEETTSTTTLEAIDFQLTSFPNPARDRIVFETGDETDLQADGVLTIANSLGQVIDRIDIRTGHNVEVDLVGYPRGWYSALLTSESRMIGTYRFLVQ